MRAAGTHQIGADRCYFIGFRVRVISRDGSGKAFAAQPRCQIAPFPFVPQSLKAFLLMIGKGFFGKRGYGFQLDHGNGATFAFDTLR